MNQCVVCKKVTYNPSFCSAKCVDIYEGNAPRREAGFVFKNEGDEYEESDVDRFGSRGANYGT
jgi:hypothetical protein